MEKFLVIGSDQYLDGGIMLKVVEANNLKEVLNTLENERDYESSGCCPASHYTFLTAIPVSALYGGWDWNRLEEVENPLQDIGANYWTKKTLIEERKRIWCGLEHGKMRPVEEDE